MVGCVDCSLSVTTEYPDDIIELARMALAEMKPIVDVEKWADKLARDVMFADD